MKLMLTIELADRYVSMIEDSFTNLEVVMALDPDLQEKELNDSEIVVGFGDSFNPEIIKEGTSLRWIQSWAAGVDHYTRPEVIKKLIDNNIKLTSMSGIHGDIIAEHVMGMVIGFSRKLYKFYQQQQNSIWQRIQPDQLAGKTMAVIGLGSIGQEIASRAKAFKMKVVGVKRNTLDKVDMVDELYSAEELFKVLAVADYVVVIVPLTDDTIGMFGYDEFRAMKETAFFINVSRGQVVIEQELITALQEGCLAGAGLDVFNQEPLPEDSPLYKLDNVLLTPHVAGIFPDYNKEAIKKFLFNLRRYQEGKELINLVDYNSGY
ncbi:MAG: D-2-hydroxyacid dehydrogenase [Firmicutes bacterium]|nr:D-2-hydroxyacid dehydrogenase [Bacillota bacterium]